MAGDDGAFSFVLVIGLSRLALGANTLDDVESLSTVTFAGVEVIDLVGSALDSADSLVDIVKLALRAFGAEIVDEEEAGFADTSVLDPIFIDCTNGGADTIASLSTGFSVPVNAVAALVLLVVDLGLGIADAAHSSDEVVTWEASAGADGGVPNFVYFARRVADTIGSVVDLSRRANSARISNQIVSSLALTSSISPFLIGIASRDAETKVQKISDIAYTALGE